MYSFLYKPIRLLIDDLLIEFYLLVMPAIGEGLVKVTDTSKEEELTLSRMVVL